MYPLEIHGEEDNVVDIDVQALVVHHSGSVTKDLEHRICRVSNLTDYPKSLYIYSNIWGILLIYTRI